MDFAFVRFREEVPQNLLEAAISLLSRRHPPNAPLSILRVPPELKNTQHGVEQVADEIRRMLGVYRGPIYDPAMVVDDAGVEVYTWPHSRSNSAVSVRFGHAIFCPDTGSGYDIVFELVSIVLNGLSFGKGVSIADEAWARKVAAAVLLPRAEIQRELGTNRPIGYPDSRVVAYFSVKYGIDVEKTIKRLVAAGAVVPMVADMVDLEEAKRLASGMARGDAKRSYLRAVLASLF